MKDPIQISTQDEDFNQPNTGLDVFVQLRICQRSVVPNFDGVFQLQRSLYQNRDKNPNVLSINVI